MKSVVAVFFYRSGRIPSTRLERKSIFRRGKWVPSSKTLWNQMLVSDITVGVPELQIPVYFLHGVYDYTVAYPLTKEYFMQLKAPLKGFYTFEHSAHSPIFEEAEGRGESCGKMC